MKLFIILSLIFSFASAQLETNKPIEISADSLEVDQSNSKAIFQGNVIANQGNINLQSNRMKVFYNKESKEDKISKIEITGNVFISTPEESAQGDKGVYDVLNKVIRLDGNVLLTRGQNVLQGDNLIYNLETGKSLIKTNKDKAGRVRGVFIPNKGSDD